MPARTLPRAPTHEPGRPGGRPARRSRRRKNVFEDIALAHREIYALYEIAQAMGTSLGVADTMALISSKLSNLVPFSCCALFLYDEETETLRCRFATGVDAERDSAADGPQRRGPDRLGRAQPPAARQRAAERRPRSGRPRRRSTTLQSALVCPLVFNERFIGTLSVYHTEPRLLHRRPPPAARPRLRAGRRRSSTTRCVFEQTQEDSLTDPLTGPAEHALHVHAPDARAGARRAAEVGGLAARHGPRQLQGDQRHLRPPRRRPRAARSRRACCAPRIRPYDICVRYAGDEFIVVLSGCGAEEAERKRLELQTRRRRRLRSRRGPGKRLPLGDQRRRGRLPARRRLATRRCSPRPTAACTATRRGRKRGTLGGGRGRRSSGNAARPAPGLSDVELKQSATGLL